MTAQPHPLTAQALDRLDPRDFYTRLDALRDAWVGNPAIRTKPDSPEEHYADYRRQEAAELHEREIDQRLRYIGRLIQQLPPQFYGRANPLFITVKRARVADSVDGLGDIAQLRRIVSEWDHSRPPLVACPECGLEVRGQDNLKSHRQYVHNLEDGS